MGEGVCCGAGRGVPGAVLPGNGNSIASQPQPCECRSTRLGLGGADLFNRECFLRIGKGKATCISKPPQSSNGPAFTRMLPVPKGGSLAFTRANKPPVDFVTRKKLMASR